MNIKKRFVLFSIETPNDKHERHQPFIEAKLAEYGFKKVIGCYKGSHESSYMVLANEDSVLELIATLAMNFKQESILIVDEDRKAYLIDPRWLITHDYDYLNAAECIGQWTSIDAEEASKLDNYTIDGLNYYTTI